MNLEHVKQKSFINFLLNLVATFSITLPTKYPPIILWWEVKDSSLIVWKKKTSENYQ